MPHITWKVFVPRHLDSSLMDVDVHPTYVSIVIKSKVIKWIAMWGGVREDWVLHRLMSSGLLWSIVCVIFIYWYCINMLSPRICRCSVWSECMWKIYSIRNPIWIHCTFMYHLCLCPCLRSWCWCWWSRYMLWFEWSSYTLHSTNA